MRKYLLAIVLLSFLPILQFFITPELVHTHDGLVHLPRLGAFYKAMWDGQFPVRWAGDLNYGSGMPIFIFIYHTPYAIASLFLLFGFGLVNAFKLTILASFLLSGIFMFLFAKVFFKDERIAFFVALLYQFAPFHLIDVATRGSFGEMFTYTFLPLVLYALTNFFQTRNTLFFILGSFATAFLIISHNSISLLFFGICCLFVLFFAGSKKQALLGLLSLFGGLLLSAYYWIPALFEHKYTYGDLFMMDLFRDRFPPLWKLLVPFPYDLPALQIDNILLQIGVLQTVAIVIALLFLFRKKQFDKKEKRALLFAGILIVFSFFFMTKLSLPVWEHVSFLRQFQFPWRFLAIIVFATALLGVVFSDFTKRKKWFLGSCFVIVFSSIVYWYPKEGTDKIDEQYYWNFPLNTTYYGETDVIWSAGPATEYPEERIQIIDGEGEIVAFHKQSNKQTFTADLQFESYLVSHTQYFPGWRVYVDGAEVPVQFQNPDYRGLITFNVPSGRHYVRLQFEETKLRLGADVLSGISLVVVGILPFVRKKL